MIIQSFRLSEIGLVAAAGINPMYLMGTAAQATPSAIVAAGAAFVGVNKDASNLPDVVAGLKAVGLRVLAWTVDMQNDYDDVMAAGCDGIFTNEPLYAARDYGYRSTTAPWSDRRHVQPRDAGLPRGRAPRRLPDDAGRPWPLRRRGGRVAVGVG